MTSREREAGFVAGAVAGAGRAGDQRSGEGDAETHLLDDPEEPARRAFEAMVDAAIDDLPREFAAQLATVAILVDDDPPPGRQLFGLYEGVPRTRLSADSAAWPSRITLYRRPHELHFPDPVARAEAVRSTLLHEVGHHLGIDEVRMREIEAARHRHGRTAV